MNEFFDLLSHDMFARIFIFCEVWLAFILGYLSRGVDKKLK